ncbi:MAG TPA: SCO family protein [Acidobacteriaceae bacterium]
MKTQHTASMEHERIARIAVRTSSRWRMLVAACVLLSCFAGAKAQVSPTGQKEMGEPADDKLPSILNGVNIQQHLNQQLPLDASFVDETGKTVRLGQYFDGKHPVLLALVYYKCPILCSEELKGLTGALEMVSYQPGKDFQIVAISIDPTETPAIAASKKREYVTYYGHPESAPGWHFLTGQQAVITAVARATGFGYVRSPGPNGKMDQFAHVSAMQIVTPEGRIAQYYLGVEYSPQDLRLGLIEASHHKIGTPVDTILTYCYHYDPTLNKHSLMIARIVQAGCLLTVLILGSYMLVMFRRDIKSGRAMANQQHSAKA